MRMVAVLSCTATATGFRPMVALAMRTSISFGQRTTTLFASGWRQVVGDDGQPYYYNDASGESQWEAPAAGTLPPGWSTGQNDDGQIYYVNEQTGESQWEAPDELDAYGSRAANLDFGQYRQFVRESGENLSESELRRRFDQLADVAQSYDGGRDQIQDAPSYTGGAYNYAPQRAERLNERRARNPNRYSEPTALQEFLRWQEWYVQYCKLRNIGQ